MTDVPEMLCRDLSSSSSYFFPISGALRIRNLISLRLPTGVRVLQLQHWTAMVAVYCKADKARCLLLASCHAYLNAKGARQLFQDLLLIKVLLYTAMTSVHDI